MAIPPPRKPKLIPQFQTREDVYIELDYEASCTMKEICQWITDECGEIPDPSKIEIRMGYVDYDGDHSYMTEMSVNYPCRYTIQRYTDEEYKEIKQKHQRAMQKWRTNYDSWKKHHESSWEKTRSLHAVPLQAR